MKDIPIESKYVLTIEEAAAYFRVGENRLRRLAAENPLAPYFLTIGNRTLIKRVQFEKFIDSIDTL